MNINITGIDIEITEALRNYVHTKLEKLTTFFNHITNTHVTLKVEKLRHIAKADVHLAKSEINASSEAEDMYAAIDMLFEKLRTQVVEHKERLNRGH